MPKKQSSYVKKRRGGGNRGRRVAIQHAFPRCLHRKPSRRSSLVAGGTSFAGSTARVSMIDATDEERSRLSLIEIYHFATRRHPPRGKSTDDSSSREAPCKFKSGLRVRGCRVRARYGSNQLLSPHPGGCVGICLSVLHCVRSRNFDGYEV